MCKDALRVCRGRISLWRIKCSLKQYIYVIALLLREAFSQAGLFYQSGHLQQYFNVFSFFLVQHHNFCSRTGWNQNILFLNRLILFYVSQVKLVGVTLAHSNVLLFLTTNPAIHQVRALTGVYIKVTWLLTWRADLLACFHTRKVQIHSYKNDLILTKPSVLVTGGV